MKKTKVAFVRPPNLQQSGAWKKQGVVRCPLNISLLASYLREKGKYECVIVDFDVIPVESAFQMAQKILEEDPKYICFTTLTPRFPIVVETAQEIKKLNPDIPIIVGGPHVTGSPKTALFDGISYAIYGEGEEALLELLNTLEEGKNVSSTKNLIYKDSRGKVVINEPKGYITDLDDLPFAAWDLMSLDEYTDPAYFDGSHLAIFSGRGCPYDCNFCASAVTWKRKLRLRSTENVIDEIRHIVRTLKISNLMFWDDTFSANHKRAVDICNRINEENLDINYTVQVRADSITEELVHALKRSGCSFAAIGVESGNEEMLRRIGKNETKEQFVKAMEIMKNSDLPTIASYIIGLQGDTHETIQETIDFAFELDATQSKFMILSPYPGTNDYEYACKKGLVDPYSFEQMKASNYYDSVAINLSNVSDDDLIRYQDEAYDRFDKLNSNV